ncbi:hypothetical protein [Sporosarcina sp. P34]|uniref:hypothetical protein n=1 Tax=Sporosarcina sp. P34 TaxID=2048247 RepID=UPI001E529C25|nr:hypothetical protein [Sporosarcina sp. P34]
MFYFTGKSAGYDEIEYEHIVIRDRFCEGSNHTGQCFTPVYTGVFVKVEQIGSIIHVEAGGVKESDH